MPLILCLFFIGSFFCTSCTKDGITLTVVDSVRIQAFDTSVPMIAKNWSLYSYQTLSLVDSGQQTYFTTNEGVKFKGQAYRLGARLQTKTEVAIYTKTLYCKWKGNNASMFGSFAPQLKYDPYTTDSSPAIQSVDFDFFCMGNSLTGFTLIQPDTWYYTRMVPVAGTYNYQIVTSSGNYNNLGGTVVSTKTVPVYTRVGYPAIRMGDPYAGVNSYMVVAECRIGN
jgi:hypothetical protein